MRKVLLALALISSSAVYGDTLTETFDRTFNVRPGTQFELENVNGKVAVTSWDQPRVRIQAVKKVQSRDDGLAAEAMRKLKIDIRQDARELSVDTIYPKKDDFGFIDALLGTNVNASVTYDVTVPRNMNVAVDNVNGGIHVTDVSGELELDTTNGGIEVVRCAGTVDASTTNGGIRAELLTVTPGKTMRFDTTNGGITLIVPPALAAEVNAATTNGSVRSDLPLTTSKFSRTSLRGSLNGGGPEIRLRTTNGGITIRSTDAVRASN
jgi:DUF4097 and DUF4098 domain-containing protein YvlB